MRVNAPDRGTTSLGRGRHQPVRPLLIKRHRLQTYPLYRAIRFGMLDPALELRPRAVTVLNCYDVLRIAKLEALARTITEHISRASERLGLTRTESAQQPLGVLAVMLKLHDVLLRVRPASASSGGKETVSSI
jgi:hypothetical protein